MISLSSDIPLVLPLMNLQGLFQITFNPFLNKLIVTKWTEFHSFSQQTSDKVDDLKWACGKNKIQKQPNKLQTQAGICMYMYIFFPKQIDKDITLLTHSSNRLRNQLEKQKYQDILAGFITRHTQDLSTCVRAGWFTLSRLIYLYKT